MVSGSFPLFLHMRPLHLCLFSFSVGEDFTTLLLLWCFPSHCNIAGCIEELFGKCLIIQTDCSRFEL